MPFITQGKTNWIFIIIFAVLAALIAGGVLFYINQTNKETTSLNNAPEVKIPEEVSSGKVAPTFKDFPISEKFEGAPAPVNFSSNPKAAEFKTALTLGAKGGPNFAGYFTVVSWGCGTECQIFAIVDAKTGNVYFPDFGSELGQEFHIDSNLLVVNPPSVIQGTYKGAYPGWETYSAYYVWDGTQLNLLFDTRTANWKTYKNNDLGFQINYPGDWDYFPTPDFVILAPAEHIKEVRENAKAGDIGMGPGHISMISFGQKKLSEQEMENFITSSSVEKVTTQKVLINNIEAYRYREEYIAKDEPWGFYNAGDVLVSYLIPTNSGYLYIHLLKSQYLDTFEKIVSTFNFLK